KSALAGAIVIALTIIPLPAAAQQHSSDALAARAAASLSGRILDPATGEYLRNAVIRVSTPTGRRTALSGDRGEYRVTGVPAGEVELTVEFTGYITASMTVDVQPGESR